VISPEEPVSPAALVLQSVSGPGGRRSFPLDREHLTIGRGPENDVTLEDDYVTGAHARLDLQGADLFVTDLGSTNGTWVNGERIGRTKRLAAGDAVRIGATEFRVLKGAGTDEE
jgi:pSer/pThr/pTyr-binding forkhead associated (FHA) protein